MPHLFAYGTLMSEEIVEAVVGYVPKRGEGSITGYRRFGVKNEDYPGIVPAEKSTVAGVVYFDIDMQGWGRLDLFEGEMYDRSRVVVAMADGSRLQAETYVVKPSFSSYLTDTAWSFTRFEKTGKPLFLTRYVGFEHLDD